MHAVRMAQKRLKGYRGRAAVAAGLPTVTGMVLTAAEWILWRRYAADSWQYTLLLLIAAWLAEGLIVAPLRLGKSRFFARLAAGEVPSRVDFTRFWARRQYARSLAWWWATVWRSLLTAVWCGLPAAMMTEFCRRLSRVVAGDLYIVYGFSKGITVFLWLIAACLYAVWTVRRIPARFAAATTDLPIRRCFAEGNRRLKGQYGRLVTQIAGLAGWGMLCVAAVPYLYVAPLCHTTVSLWVGELPTPTAPTRTAARHGKTRLSTAV